MVKEAVFTNYMLDGRGFESPTRGNSISLKDECLGRVVLRCCCVALPCLSKHLIQPAVLTGKQDATYLHAQSVVSGEYKYQL